MDDRICSNSETTTKDDDMDSIDYASLLAYLQKNPWQLQKYIDGYFQKNPHLAHLLKGPDQVKVMQRLEGTFEKLKKNVAQVEKNNREFDTKFEAMGTPYRG